MHPFQSQKKRHNVMVEILREIEAQRSRYRLLQGNQQHLRLEVHMIDSS